MKKTIEQDALFEKQDYMVAFLPAGEYDNCQLSFASFYTTKLKKTRFSQCVMHETDFSEADLSQAVLEGCDLSGAVFSRSNLEGCDLRTAIGYSFDPEENRVKGARLSSQGALRLLDKYKLKIEL